MRFAADANGVTRLDLPDGSDHGDVLANLKDLTASGARSVAEDGRSHRIIRSAPGAPMTVRYRIVSAIDHDPGRSEG